MRKIYCKAYANFGIIKLKLRKWIGEDASKL